MRQQKIDKPVAAKVATVIDSRPHKPIDKQVRTVIFAEVGDMESAKVSQLLAVVRQQYVNNASMHYVIPIRHGKIGSDIVFESEFLGVVNSVCEIVDNKIVLKGGATDISVVRSVV